MFDLFAPTVSKMILVALDESLELCRNLKETILVLSDLTATESPWRQYICGGAWGDRSFRCGGGGGGSEKKLLYHFETRREMKRKKLTFVEKLISRRCG
jgi:hypothetical protein